MVIGSGHWSRWGEGWATERHGEILSGDETVLYLNCGHGYVYQNLQNFTLKGVDFYYVSIILEFFKNRERLPRELLLQLGFER